MINKTWQRETCETKLKRDPKKIPETLQFQEKMLVSISVPIVALFLEKSPMLLWCLHPQLKVTPAFCYFPREFQFHSQFCEAASISLSSHTFTSSWQLLVCIRGCPSTVPTFSSLTCGDDRISLIRKIIKIIKISWVCHGPSQEPSLAQQGKCYKSS